MIKSVLFCLCYIIALSSQEDNAKILCSKRFCEEFVEKTTCPVLPENCKIQNATHNGLELPYAGPCNCCKYCVENLALGDECNVGTPDGPVPNIICGDGLSCDPTTSKCVANPTDCIKAQQKYQKDKKEGNLGHLQLRPHCDKRGQFQQLKCIPGETCFCVDKNGQRIFGELPYNIQSEDMTKCDCSRKIHIINNVLGTTKYTSKRSKCLSNGNYNPIQCINKRCICVQESDGNPIETKKGPMNINLVSEMPCFNPDIHKNGVYLDSCEKEYDGILDAIKSSKDEGFNDVIGYTLPSCQLDGRYAAIQENSTHKYCVDPEGEIIDSYIIEKSDSLANSMNCYCARARTIISGFEKPSCCPNGNYKCIQCRRGKCRCVDTYGEQTKKEVDYNEQNTLVCKNCKQLCTA